MKTQQNNTGQELVFLLKQQRNLYHQLRALAEKQSKIFWASASPEELVKLLAGRRKLLEKLRQVNGKLKPIKANWTVIEPKIEVEQRIQAHELALSVSTLVDDLKEMALSKEQPRDILSDTAQLAAEFAQEEY